MCARTVGMSGFCKVEMSKLPFREAISEAEIDLFSPPLAAASTWARHRAREHRENLRTEFTWEF